MGFCKLSPWRCNRVHCLDVGPRPRLLGLLSALRGAGTGAGPELERQTCDTRSPAGKSEMERVRHDSVSGSEQLTLVDVKEIILRL